eukprot:s591_g16.t1
MGKLFDSQGNPFKLRIGFQKSGCAWMRELDKIGFDVVMLKSLDLNILRLQWLDFWNMWVASGQISKVSCKQFFKLLQTASNCFKLLQVQSLLTFRRTRGSRTSRRSHHAVRTVQTSSQLGSDQRGRAFAAA